MISRCRESKGKSKLFYCNPNGEEIISRKALKVVQAEIKQHLPNPKRFKEYIKKLRRQYPNISISLLIN